MTSSEWEQFKLDVSECDGIKLDEIYYSDRRTLSQSDSIPTKIVQFTDLEVPKDFQYGDITHHKGKANPIVITIEVVFMALGAGMGVLFWMLYS